MKLNIKKRLFLLMMLGSLLSFLLLGSTMLYGINELWQTISTKRSQLTIAVSDYTRDFARDQAQERTVSETEIRARNVGFEVKSIKADVDYLSDEVTGILKSSREYKPTILPNAVDENIPVGTPYVHLSPKLRARGISPEIQSEIELVSNIAETMKNLGNYYVSVFVASKHGYTIYIDADGDKDGHAFLSSEKWRDSYDPRERFWYKTGVKSDKPVFTDVYQDVSGDNIISCVMPYYDSEGIAGVVGVDCLPDNMFFDEGNAKYKNNFILNGKGDLLMSTLPREILSLENGENVLKADGGLSRAAKFMTKGYTGYYQLYVAGKEYYLFYTPIKDTSWSMGTVVSKEQVMGDAVEAQGHILEHMDNFYGAFIRLFALIVILIIVILLVVAAVTSYGSAAVADRFVQPIRDLIKGTEAISKGDFQYKLAVKTGDEWENLANNFNQMTAELEHYVQKIVTSAKNKARLETELSMATKIQRSLLPPPMSSQPWGQLAGYVRAAQEVGGDFYDYYMIDKNLLAVTIADVSAQGVPAALYMAGVKTVLKSCISLVAKNKYTLAQAVSLANDQITAANKENFFVTAFIALFNTEDGRLVYVNAGHNSPFAYKGQTLEVLAPTRKSPVFGMREGVVYEQKNTTLGQGDVLFCYTDGIREAFSREQLKDFLFTVGKDGSPDEIMQNMSQILDQHLDINGGLKKQKDDMTMLVLKKGS